MNQQQVRRIVKIVYIMIEKFANIDRQFIMEIRVSEIANVMILKVEAALQMSDGRMWEVLTARYFSAICLPDCTVMHVTA